MPQNKFTSYFCSSLFCVLFLSGCLDITSTSQVNSNGSIVRTITFTGDSSAVYAGEFPIELDSLWSRSIGKSPGKDHNFTLTASRTFQNIGEMNNVLKGTFGKTIQYRFELEKSFRWFFTVYRYRETNIPFAQYTAIPMTDFVSSVEIDWMNKIMMQKDSAKELTTRGDSLAFDSIVPRIQEWEWRNHFEAVYNAFLDGVKSLDNPSLTPLMVGVLKDSLYKRSVSSLDKNNIDTLRIIFSRVLRSSLAEKAWRANLPAIDEIKRRMTFENSVNSHKYVTNVIMPGLITGSNARKIEGTTATWEDFKDYTRYAEYTMWVESRQVNWWAVGIAVVVVLSLAILLILSMLRRRIRI
jgi:hypothetical protein